MNPGAKSPFPPDQKRGFDLCVYVSFLSYGCQSNGTTSRGRPIISRSRPLIGRVPAGPPTGSNSAKTSVHRTGFPPPNHNFLRGARVVEQTLFNIQKLGGGFLNTRRQSQTSTCLFTTVFTPFNFSTTASINSQSCGGGFYVSCILPQQL